MKTRCGTLATLTLALAASVATFRLAAETYYWIGSSGGDWASGENWSLSEGGAAANAYPTDYAADEAYVGSDTTITLPSANANVGNLYVNANVSLTGGTIHAKNISGTGKMTMQDGTGFYATEAWTSVSVDVHVPEGANVSVSTSGTNNGYGYGVNFTSDCALSGSGTIKFESYRPINPLGWDAKEFSGKIVVTKDSQTRNHTHLTSIAATNAKMTWEVISSGGNNFIAAGGTYAFGSLSGAVYFPATRYEDYAHVKNVILEIGGLNANDYLAGQFSRSGSRTDDGASIRKVGSGILSVSATGVNTYYVKEGTLNIASNNGLSAKDNYGTPGTKIVFEGGTLRLAEGVTKDASAYIAIGTSSSPVCFDDEGRDHVWGTALGESLTGGLEKKGSGTLTLSAVPLYTGTTTVSEGALVIPGGTTLAKLSVADGATLYVSGTDGQTITITEFADGTTTDNVKAVAGSSLSWNGNTATISRSAATYTWTDATGDHNWATPGNWTIGDEVAIVAPLAIDTVELGIESTIRIATDHTVAKIILDADVTISGTDDVSRKNNGGANGNKIIFTELEGDKVLTLDNVVLQNTTATTVETSLAGVAGKTFCLNVSGGQLTLQGNLLGSGNLILTQTSNDYGVTFAGTGSTFDGTIIEYTPNNYDRGRTSFASGAATFPNATVTFTHQYTPDAKDNHTGTYDQCLVHDLAVGSVLTFGAFNGEIYAGQKSPTLIIGGKNEPCEFGGPVARGWKDNGANNNWNTKLVKTGTAKLTFTGTQLGDTIISNGTLAITQENPMWKIRRTINFAGGTLMTPQFDKTVTVTDEETGEIRSETTIKAYFDPSSFITGSQKAIVFDSDSANYEWTSKIAESNVGGLTKKGTGTLTLTASPEYTGLTTVEAGTLVVPQGTELIVNALSSGTLTGATVTKYAYPENTTLVYDGTTRNYDSELDLSNVKTVDMSGVMLVKGTTYTIVSATSIAGYSKGAIEVVLPEGADATKWALRRSGNALVLAPAGGFNLIVR